MGVTVKRIGPERIGLNGLRRMRLLSNKNGFTLIEIIVVVIIMGLLAALVVPKFFR